MTISVRRNFTSYSVASMMALMCLMVMANIATTHPHLAALKMISPHVLSVSSSSALIGGIAGACYVGVGLVAGVGFAIFDGATLGGGSFLAPLAVSAGINAMAVLCAS